MEVQGEGGRANALIFGHIAKFKIVHLQRKMIPNSLMRIRERLPVLAI
jgi:hypothetical protein